MTTSAPSLQLSQATDAEFRAWGSGVSTALAAVGLVQTSDTGQINWTTVLKPSSTSQSRGYEIWRFSDSLQSTKPVFIKVEYGSSSGAALTPSIYITIGTATNGSGTLTGTLISTLQAMGGQNLSTFGVAPVTCYFSGDTSSFQMMLSICTVAGTAPVPYVLVGVERTRDSSGVATNEGVAVCGAWTAQSSPGNLFQVLSFASNVVSTAAGRLPIPALHPRITAFNIGSDIIVFPYVMSTPKVQASPLGFLGLASASGLLRYTTVTVSLSGSSHTYMVVTSGGASGGCAFISLDSSSVGVDTLMRYE